MGSYVRSFWCLGVARRWPNVKNWSCSVSPCLLEAVAASRLHGSAVVAVIATAAAVAAAAIAVAAALQKGSFPGAGIEEVGAVEE